MSKGGENEHVQVNKEAKIPHNLRHPRIPTLIPTQPISTAHRTSWPPPPPLHILTATTTATTMLSRTPTLRALRAATLRPLSKPHPQFTRPFSRLQPRAPTPPLARPSLTLTYRALPIHLQTSIPPTLYAPRAPATTPPQTPASTPPASPTWTRFTTAYSYSSIRTFSTTRPRPSIPAAPASASPDAAATDPNAAQRIEEVIEEIQELYGTARDEFEIATEETEKNSTYAEDDRAAAREELDRLLEYYNGVLGGGDRAVAEEVKRRVGGRIRELEQAVLALEEVASHGD
ncbi:hypothetical protein K505DRAFT_416914 [Melanomma pulvis-pyrius CBS 109.77]|uniref:BAG domain-containing protein n=1 Tax=Melanomma pulvis-pyrius CBS 109.77 TaxID=1314802 RepID=A0A6A6XE45_9PLEO|nr:hypothetical protein K505DRAFT_416914 [Melanomma pulvis-pyrius CBS 109.77]